MQYWRCSESRAQQTEPGTNAQRLARIIASSVVAAELSFLSALEAGHLVRARLMHDHSGKHFELLSPCNTWWDQPLRNPWSGSFTFIIVITIFGIQALIITTILDGFNINASYMYLYYDFFVYANFDQPEICALGIEGILQRVVTLRGEEFGLIAITREQRLGGLPVRLLASETSGRAQVVKRLVTRLLQ
jgi:Hydroxymethylglutaryl-coenzyme A reductase